VTNNSTKLSSLIGVKNAKQRLLKKTPPKSSTSKRSASSESKTNADKKKNVVDNNVNVKKKTTKHGKLKKNHFMHIKPVSVR